MADEDRPRPRCFLALPYSPDFRRVREAIKMGVKDANWRAVALDEEPFRGGTVRDTLLGELARSDCIVADLTERNPNAFFELGVAQAMGKGVFLLCQKRSTESIPFDVSGFRVFLYEPNRPGLSELTKWISANLRLYRHSPRRAQLIPGSRLATPFFVEWDRLDRSEAENLCRELLAQMGFQRLDWEKESREIDLIAELPRKDPDGFEYRELWFVTMGRNYPPEKLLEIAAHDPEFVIRRLLRSDERLERLTLRGRDVTITLLVIMLRGESSSEEFDKMRLRLQHRMSGGLFPFSFRVRVWDRNYLTSLVQQFPQIGYKYFSDEGRSQSRYRKTPQELYQENVDLTGRLTIVIDALEDEKNKRVRAERDAVWKDISFTAAHKIGNPIFAIETNLDPLHKRVAESRTEEATEVIGSIRASVEKAKGIVDQFKSLTRAQEISPVPTLLLPILEDACVAPRNQGVSCEIECSPDIRVEGDPVRLAECFDELASNALHWLSNPSKKIKILVAQPAPLPLPQAVDSSRKYALIHFTDNGFGVPLECKTKIFDAFFTTRDHGTGLGLAVVRRIIEGHGGVILETGRPGEGADFEVYLPLAAEAGDATAVPAQSPKAKRTSAKARKRKRKE